MAVYPGRLPFGVTANLGSV